MCGWLPSTDDWALTGVKRSHRRLATTPAASVFHWCAAVNLYRRSTVRSSRRSHSILYFRCHCHESLFYIRRIFGRCLEEGNSELFSIFLRNQPTETQLDSPPPMCGMHRHGVFITWQWQMTYYGLWRQVVVMIQSDPSTLAVIPWVKERGQSEWHIAPTDAHTDVYRYIVNLMLYTLAVV